VIQQAVGIPKAHDAAIPFMHAFVEEMKSSGFVARALTASGQSDATVAPAVY
jgi:polar amino acid transport system substrate-binding protein